MDSSTGNNPAERDITQVEQSADAVQLRVGEVAVECYSPQVIFGPFTPRQQRIYNALILACPNNYPSPAVLNRARDSDVRRFGSKSLRGILPKPSL